MFRCRYDNICIHPHNICDGVVHCRHSHDDESLCDVHCPYRCTCTGLTAVCNSTTERTERKKHPKYSLHGLKVLQTRADFRGLIHSCTSLIVLFVQHTDVSGGEFIDINNNVMLYSLTLNDNNIKVIRRHTFNNLALLRYLEIYNNSIAVLEDNAFDGMHNLQVLNVSGLSLNQLEDCCLCGMATLKNIDLSNNSLTDLRPEMLLTTNPVRSIDLSNNNFKHIQQLDITSYEKLHFTDQTYFCFLLKSRHNFVDEHISASNCKQLLTPKGYVVAYTTLTLLLLIINTSVLFHHLSFTAQHIFVLHLAFADMFFVCYLIIIAVAHVFYQEQFPIHREDWITGMTCKASMFTLVLSLCQSKCITFFININYLQCTIYAMKTRPFGKRAKHTILFVLWMTTSFLSAIFSIFTVNSSLLCVVPTSNSVQKSTFIFLLGYSVHLLLFLTHIFFTTFTYASIIKCIQSSAKKTNKMKGLSLIQIRVLSIKAILILISSVICDGCLASLPLMKLDATGKMEKYIVLIIIPQKIVVDAFVYTYINKIRQLINI